MSTPVELSEGATVADRYKLQARLGAGSMGSVWAAVHMQLGHRVAIKFLNLDTQAVPEALERFMLEGQLAAQLGHTSKHIVKVLDHGVLPVRAGGEIVERPFIVMEHLAGDSLAQRLRNRGRLSLSDLRPVVQQLARALTAIHRHGVIHRDLKPGNVFLVRAEEEDGSVDVVKLLDFGIAKSSSSELTATGTILGTPAYMSPEQVRGDREVDARADLWALAATVYAAAVGESPFGPGTLGELTARVLWSRVVPPSEKLGRPMPGFDFWVARGLAREPSARFQSADELAQAFEAMLIDEVDEDVGDRKLPFGLGASNDETAAYGLLAPLPGDKPSGSPRLRGRWGVAAFVLLGGVVLFFRAISAPTVTPANGTPASAKAVGPRIVPLPDAAAPRDAS